MTLYVLAVIFAVLGIVCILLPFHVAMTGLCFLALGAVCLALRLLRGYCRGGEEKGEGSVCEG